MSLAHRIWTDQTAATSLEWTLLLAAIALPGYYAIRMASDAVVGHYQMITLLNSLPFP
jgi:Flp pilus assembly pilin Flp